MIDVTSAIPSANSDQPTSVQFFVASTIGSKGSGERGGTSRSYGNHLRSTQSTVRDAPGPIAADLQPIDRTAVTSPAMTATLARLGW